MPLQDDLQMDRVRREMFEMPFEFPDFFSQFFLQRQLRLVRGDVFRHDVPRNGHGYLLPSKVRYKQAKCGGNLSSLLRQRFLAMGLGEGTQSSTDKNPT